MSKHLGIWKHKLTGETYEIRQISPKVKDLVMVFRTGLTDKLKEPFMITENWNCFCNFEKIE